MAAKQESTTQPNVRCWVWFRGGLNQDPHWMSGFYGAPSVLGGVRIERSDYVLSRLPDWRVLLQEPTDMKVGPVMPEGGDWAKLVPVDPR